MSGHYFLLAKARDINAAAEAAAKVAEKSAQDAKKTKTERELESLLEAIPNSPLSLKLENSSRDKDGNVVSSAGVSADEPDGVRINAKSESSNNHPRGQNILSGGDGSDILPDDEEGGARRTRCAETVPCAGFRGDSHLPPTFPSCCRFLPVLAGKESRQAEASGGKTGKKWVYFDFHPFSCSIRYDALTISDAGSSAT